MQLQTIWGPPPEKKQGLLEEHKSDLWCHNARVGDGYLVLDGLSFTLRMTCKLEHW